MNAHQIVNKEYKVPQLSRATIYELNPYKQFPA